METALFNLGTGSSGGHERNELVTGQRSEEEEEYKSSEKKDPSVNDELCALSIELQNLINSKATEEIMNKFVNSEFVSFLQENLLIGSSSSTSSATVKRKHAGFILKSLTSYFLTCSADDDLMMTPKNKQMDEQAAYILRLRNGREEFKNFWSDFFDLYEIFDEKQSHIIEPFLVKLRCSEKFQQTPSWLRILVLKLIHHDNRLLAKEGLTIYLDHCLQQSSSLLQQEGDKNFIQLYLFPVLRDRVGWILPTAKELDSAAEKLALLYSSKSDENSVSVLLKFVAESETSMSPVATYFFVLAGCREIKCSTKNSPETWSLDRASFLKNIFTLMNFVMSYRMNAIDRFLKVKIQQEFIKTILHLFSNKTLISAWINEQANLDQFLSFLGLVNFDVFKHSVSTLGKVVISTLTRDVAAVSSKTPTRQASILGLYRLYYLTMIDDRAELEQFCDKAVQVLGSYLAKLDGDNVEMVKDHLSAFVDVTALAVVECDGLKSQNVRKATMTTLISALNKFLELDIANALTESDIVELVSPVIISDSSSTVLPLNVDTVDNLVSLVHRTDIPAALRPSLLMLFLKEETAAKLIESQPRIAVALRSLVAGLCDSHRIHHEDKSRKNELTSEFLRQKLLVLQETLKRSDVVRAMELNSDLVERILEATLDAVESGSAVVLPTAIHILNTITHFQSSAGTDSVRETMKEQVDRIWNAVLDLHKSEYFVDALGAFAGFISLPDLAGAGIFTKYSEKIFEFCTNMPGLVLLLSEALSKVDVSSIVKQCDEEYMEEFINVNLKASCFGFAIPKSARLTYLIWEYLCDIEQDPINHDTRLSMPFSGGTKSRLLSILTLLDLLGEEGRQRGEEVKLSLLETIVGKLLEMNGEDSVDKRRYFTGSYVHRFKQRIVQFLLILQPLFNSELSQRVLEALVTSLGQDGPQASVRYLTEWIVIKILLEFPELQEQFFALSKEYIQVRPGFGCLFATVSMHAGLSFEDEAAAESFIDSALKILTGLLMGQNFTVRIYGNICFCKLYEHAMVRKLGRIVGKYQVVNDSAKEAVATAAGNFRKIYEHIWNDFYLKNFSPLGHYYPEIIFNALPKISRMASDEVIHLQDLRLILQKSHVFSSLGIPGRTPDDVLSLYQNEQEYSWHLKANLIDGREHGLESAELDMLTAVEESENPVQFQVKAKPWKYLPTSEELSDFTEEIQLKKLAATREDGLVVVASLVDRIPNLGGLCRTCEIFGVSKYVISSMKILDDQQFKSMSVSAHRWVDILEVPPYELKTLLSSYSAKGYKIVAAEQALDSCGLQSYKFPKKTLLLLGNEKYGIPTDLLNLVDQCIEIPQVGLIRSLNVHVTGALCVWQYATQHVI